MGFYYRVELYDYNKMATTGGFVAIINVMLLKRLNLTPLVSNEEFAIKVGTSEDPEVKMLGGMMKCLLEDMKPPEEYTSDKSKRHCLFTESTLIMTHKKVPPMVTLFETLDGFIQDRKRLIPSCA